MAKDKARLQWQCRRGMLELDAMLMAFLEKKYDGLNAQQQHVFEQLLSQPDQMLLEILMGRSVSIDKDVADVAQQIRQAAGP